MGKKINLEEILLNVVVGNNNSFDLEIEYKITQDVILSMKEACRQVLELATENAKITEVNSIPEDNYDIIERYDPDARRSEQFIVSKQSILNTINQVE